MRELELIDSCRPLTVETLSDDEAEATARIFKALADPARVKIVNVFATSGEAVCACDFMPSLGLAQATVSHHLKLLTDAGLLARAQCGKWAYFTLDAGVLARVGSLVQLPELVP
jgi:ArsR family transcriptional regulator, arsenate/arsenite/antimonite-responsive transcriptional repressor